MGPRPNAVFEEVPLASHRAVERNERLRALWELEISELDDRPLRVHYRECHRQSDRPALQWMVDRKRSFSIWLAPSSVGSATPSSQRYPQTVITLDAFEGSINKGKVL